MWELFVKMVYSTGQWYFPDPKQEERENKQKYKFVLAFMNEDAAF